MASKPSISRAPSNASSNVRRNLFHHHLSRRPTSVSTSTSATTLPESPQEDSSEIVVRDQSGNYDVQVPLLPPLDGEQAQDDEATEKEKNEAKVLEMYKNRSIQPGEPTELLSAVQSSLRRTVASLDEDDWIFEANCWSLASEPSSQAYVNRRSQ